MPGVPAMLRTLLVLVTAACSGACCGAYAAAPREAPLSFAVMSGLPSSAAEQNGVARMLQAIGRERDLAFVVHDGNLKSSLERCDDSLLGERKDLLNSSVLPLVYLPAENDWIRCATHEAGGYEPLERLDFIRRNFLADAASLGRQPLRLTRESDVSRFAPYRENVRWELNEVLFVGLDVPGDNNHFLDAGGRNGEFEDRAVANAFWLRHALEYSRRRKVKAIVIFIQGDPGITQGVSTADRTGISWLRFMRATSRDGYREFKEELARLVRGFDGPVLLVDNAAAQVGAGFRLELPHAFADPYGGAHADSRIHNRGDKTNKPSDRNYREREKSGGGLTELQLTAAPHQIRWVEVAIDPAHKSPFRVRLHTLAADMRLDTPNAASTSHPDAAIAAPADSASEMAPSLPSTPAMLPLPPASDSAPRLAQPPEGIFAPTLPGSVERAH
jgi:hypothetical protein